MRRTKEMVSEMLMTMWANHDDNLWWCFDDGDDDDGDEEEDGDHDDGDDENDGDDDDDDGDEGDDDDDSGFETHWVPPLQTSKPLANGTFDCSAFREQHISPRTVDMAEDFHKRMNAQHVPETLTNRLVRLEDKKEIPGSASVSEATKKLNEIWRGGLSYSK